MHLAYIRAHLQPVFVVLEDSMGALNRDASCLWVQKIPACVTSFIRNFPRVK